MFSPPPNHAQNNDILTDYSILPVHQSPFQLIDDPPNVTTPKFESSRFSKSPPPSPIILSIPRSPKSVQNQSTLFFQKFDRECITSAHYFAWHDYNQFYTKWLPAMAEEHIALQHARLAFSALIYSTKVDSRAKEIAFLYYAATLREFRLLLNTPLNQKESDVAVATSLQLSSFDVRVDYDKLMVVFRWGYKKMFPPPSRRRPYIGTLFNPLTTMLHSHRAVVTRMVLHPGRLLLFHNFQGNNVT
jgi:Fungal specific transcription factor domain